MMNLNLDSKTGREIMDILKLTNQKYNQTILLVTHDVRAQLLIGISKETNSDIKQRYVHCHLVFYCFF